MEFLVTEAMLVSLIVQSPQPLQCITCVSPHFPFQVISIVCISVWLINIGHFSDPAHGGSWIRVSASEREREGRVCVLRSSTFLQVVTTCTCIWYAE